VSQRRGSKEITWLDLAILLILVVCVLAGLFATGSSDGVKVNHEKDNVFVPNNGRLVIFRIIKPRMTYIIKPVDNQVSVEGWVTETYTLCEPDCTIKVDIGLWEELTITKVNNGIEVQYPFAYIVQ
jgi:hypothetical protein